MSEQIQILRRIAERGLRLAQNDGYDIDVDAIGGGSRAHKKHLDLWQHMLDEIGRLPEKD